jgi:hypothetical protein
MSVYAGPEFNESGLIYYHDMNNKKSYVGAPTTNHVPSADTMPGWSTYGGTPVAFQTEFGTTGYRLTNAPSWNGIYRTVTLPSTGTYTFSTWIRYLGGSPNNNGGTVYISGWGGGDTSTAVNKSIIGQWQRVTRTLTVTTTSMTFYIISFGGTNDGNSDRSSWEITMPQVEAGSVATTFVAGTRSSTQVLRDLTGLNTITAPSLTYNANSTFSFNGTTDYVDTGNTFIFAQSSQFSAEVWLKILDHSDRPSAAAGIIGKGHFYDNQWDIFLLNNNSIYFETSGNPTRQGQVYLVSPVLALNTWHHYVATYNNGAKSIYLNGNLVGTQTYTGPGDFSNTNNVLIGRRFNDASRSLRGDISVAKIYSRALPAAEVFSNFTASRLRYGI